ncbi:hypothetical protein NC651_007871 [Populus alba x Populus x berolinensis]|nr:hypothetical protein NC651_007871 [Populus alba x Populus x berolinensis]
MRKKKHVKGKGLNLVSPNNFDNQVHEEFVVFALVVKKVIEKPLEEVSTVLKEFQDVFPLKSSPGLQLMHLYILEHSHSHKRKNGDIKEASSLFWSGGITKTYKKFRTSDYLRKISLKMLTMETKSQNIIPTGNGNKPLDPGASHGMPPQVHNQGQSLPISLSTNQPQARQQLPQNMQNSMSSNGVQSSAGLQSAIPSVSGLTQTIPNTVGQNANMQGISGVSQNPVGNSMGQGIPSNMFVNSQRQMPGRQQVVPPQQQQQPQNPQQYVSLSAADTTTAFKAEASTGKSSTLTCAISHPPAAAAAKLVTAKSVAIFSAIWFANINCYAAFNDVQTVSGLQQNQPSSVQQSTQPMHQQHPQSVLRQQQQQPQQSAGQRLLGQQNNLQNLQQQQQQLGPQSNVTGLQQQPQPGNSSMQSNQHSLHMLQQPKATLQQQAQQSGSALLPNQGQQSHSQLSQQQLMAQIQSQAWTAATAIKSITT